MAKMMTMEELYARIEPWAGMKGHYCYHRRTKRRYIITDVVLRVSDLSVEVVYRNMGKITVSFTRPVEEFKERFEIGHHWSQEEDG